MYQIISKPDFANVYSFLSKFLEPFISQDMCPKILSGNDVSWSDVVEDN